MNRLTLSLMLVLVGLSLFTQSSGAYMIDDTTLVARFLDGTLIDWVDRIGDTEFETYGIDYSQTGYNLNFNIYTNYPETGYTVYSNGNSWQTMPGDFGFDVVGGGAYNFFLALYDHDSFSKGRLYYTGSGWNGPEYHKPAGSWFYGSTGVTAAIGTELGIGSITWTDITGSAPNYRIDLTVDVRDLVPVGFGGNIGVYWPTATSGNDIILGDALGIHNTPEPTPTPEPSTWFLLGSGLVGLLVFRVRKRHHP